MSSEHPALVSGPMLRSLLIPVEKKSIWGRSHSLPVGVSHWAAYTRTFGINLKII